MIRSRAYVPLKQNREETVEAGHELFDCVATEEDILWYIGHQVPAHWHHEVEIFHLLSGRVRVCAGNQAYDLSGEEGCFINTGVLHSYMALTDAPCRFHSFVFDAGIVAGAAGSLFDVRYVRPLLSEGAPFVRFSPDDADYFTAFEAAFAACAEEPRGYEFTVRDQFSRILLLVGSRESAAPDRSDLLQEERMKTMLEWIDAHLERDIRIEDLARAAHVCPRVCQRLFRRYLHCSPMEYCMQKRIKAAAWMLATTDKSITDIAIQYAFSSPSHFSRQFRLATGYTPTSFKRSAFDPSCSRAKKDETMSP